MDAPLLYIRTIHSRIKQVWLYYQIDSNSSFLIDFDSMDWNFNGFWFWEKASSVDIFCHLDQGDLGPGGRLKEKVE